jgi:exopolysaccharide biosynthesis polyprenyl glycosylphosphotransferase
MRGFQYRYVARTVFVLWLIEFSMLLIAAYVLPGSDPLHLLAGGWRAEVPNRAVFLAGTISTVSIAFGLYRVEVRLQIGRLLLNAIIVGVLSFGMLLSFGYLGDADFWFAETRHEVSLSKLLLAWTLCLIMTRVGFRVAYRFDLFTHPIFVVGSSGSLARIHDLLDGQWGGFCRVVGNVVPSQVPVPLEQMRQRKVRSVVLACGVQEEFPALAGCYRDHGAQVFDEAELRESQLRLLDIERLPTGWNQIIASSIKMRRHDRIQRLLDLTLSIVLLLVTSPVMLLTALAIKLESRGPVFYSQERVGKFGRAFVLRKFRSMSVHAEATATPDAAAKNNVRVTRVGRFIRRTRIDELPQVLNMLAGDISFVGPRPERPHFVSRLAEIVPNYSDRACVKPGITGWAQVNYPYGASLEDFRIKLAYDLYYVKNRRVTLDLLIIASTIRVVILQEGSR